MENKQCFFTSTVGRKYIMAFSAIVWLTFVMAHMAGNFLLFVSRQAYNSYSHLLVSGKLIYAMEGIFLLALVIHGLLALWLTYDNMKAKPQGYAVQPQGAKAPTLASQTMAIQGPIILVFIIMHLIQFKFGPVYQDPENPAMRDVYRVVVESFHQPMFMAWYVVAVIILFFHLSHGVTSIFQSLGIRKEAYIKGIEVFSLAYAIIVGGGFIVQPIFVYFFVK